MVEVMKKVIENLLVFDSKELIFDERNFFFVVYKNVVGFRRFFWCMIIMMELKIEFNLIKLVLVKKFW